jgi:hypothetical protein
MSCNNIVVYMPSSATNPYVQFVPARSYGGMSDESLYGASAYARLVQLQRNLQYTPQLAYQQSYPCPYAMPCSAPQQMSYNGNQQVSYVPSQMQYPIKYLQQSSNDLPISSNQYSQIRNDISAASFNRDRSNTTRYVPLEQATVPEVNNKGSYDIEPEEDKEGDIKIENGQEIHSKVKDNTSTYSPNTDTGNDSTNEVTDIISSNDTDIVNNVKESVDNTTVIPVDDAETDDIVGDVSDDINDDDTVENEYVHDEDTDRLSPAEQVEYTALLGTDLADPSVEDNMASENLDEPLDTRMNVNTISGGYAIAANKIINMRDPDETCVDKIGIVLASSYNGIPFGSYLVSLRNTGLSGQAIKVYNATMDRVDINSNATDTGLGDMLRGYGY